MAMNRRVGPFQRLAVLALIGGLGGCELMKHVRVQTDDRNPNSFAEARTDNPRGAQNRMEFEFRLWPQEAAE
jgi:hypothetical protein